MRFLSSHAYFSPACFAASPSCYSPAAATVPNALPCSPRHTAAQPTSSSGGTFPLNSPVAATVKHGERLEIVARRRRFMKVRTAGGVEGWTEENLLLNEDEMAALRDLAEKAKSLPSHGIATTFDALNVHTQPARQSPSFMQAQQSEKMEVLVAGDYAAGGAAAPPLIPPAPKRDKPAKKPKESKIPPVPKPVPPGPPANWLELSKTNLPPEPPPEPKPVPTDSWTLVRLRRPERLGADAPPLHGHPGRGGAVRRRAPHHLLLLPGRGAGRATRRGTTGCGPPWAEAQRITTSTASASSSGTCAATATRRPTSSATLKGYFPVKMQSVTLSTGNRAAPTAAYPGFSVCVEKADGQRYQRTFAFIVNVVRFAGEGPCEARPPLFAAPGAAPAQVASAAPEKAEAESTIFSGVKARMSALKKRWLGK